ncbi:amino acid permease, partial [Escherichia coli]|nr:amino acid permease [Escherichia coli]
LVFCFWALAGSGYQAVYYGVFCLLLGVPVYVWLKVGRGEYGETPVVPADTSAVAVAQP